MCLFWNYFSALCFHINSICKFSVLCVFQYVKRFPFNQKTSQATSTSLHRTALVNTHSKTNESIIKKQAHLATKFNSAKMEKCACWHTNSA